MASRLYSSAGTQRVVCDGSGIDETGVISFSFYYYPTDMTSNYQRVIHFRDGNLGFMCIHRFEAQNRISVSINHDTGNSGSWADHEYAVVSGNVWNCVQATVDCTGTSIDEFLLNGVQVGTVNATGYGSGTDNDSVYIGCRTDSGAGLKDGNIAYVQIWQGALTLAEFEQARWYPGTITTNMKLYLPLWGADSTEPDLSGNGKNGTVTGATASVLGPPVSIGYEHSGGYTISGAPAATTRIFVVS